MSTQPQQGNDTGKPLTDFNVHEGIIFAIELTDSLLLPIAHQGKSHLEVILESLQQSMSHSIITLPNTGYGLYFFNSAKTTEGLDEGIEQIFPVSDLNTKNMKQVHDLLEENKRTSQLYNPINDRFQPSEKRGKNPLYHLFLTLRDDFLLKKENQKLYNTTKVFLFTDNDRPVVDDVKEKNLLRKVYNDLDDIHINIKCMFLNSGAGFDRTLYSELLKIEYEDDDDEGNNQDQDQYEEGFRGSNTRPIKVEDIKDRIIRGKEIKRKLFEVPFIFSDSLVVGVKGFTIFSEQRKVKHKNFYEGPNFVKNVHIKRRLIGAEKTNHAGEEVSDFVKVWEFGDSESPKFQSTDIIALDNEKIDKLGNYYNTSDLSSNSKENPPKTFLKLLGFKPTEFGTRFAQHVTTCPFVLPNEDVYKGSTKTLIALYKSLTKQDKVAILFGRLRGSSAPAFFALQPTKQPLFPEGFILIRLPYLDELRKYPGIDRWSLSKDVDSSADVTYEKLKLHTKYVLQSFMIKGDKPYDPREFKNPALNRHFKIIQDHVLQINQDIDDPSLSAEVKAERNKQRELEEDDTLRKVMAVRLRVEDSLLGKGQDGGRLGRELSAWNDIYNKFS